MINTIELELKKRKPQLGERNKKRPRKGEEQPNSQRPVRDEIERRKALEGESGTQELFHCTRSSPRLLPLPDKKLEGKEADNRENQWLSHPIRSNLIRSLHPRDVRPCMRIQRSNPIGKNSRLEDFLIQGETRETDQEGDEFFFKKNAFTDYYSFLSPSLTILHS